MAYKSIKKVSEASVCRVVRRGMNGITIEVDYIIDGKKHQTCVSHNIEISFCDMKFIGVEFHRVMAELSKEWHSTKNAISGN